MPALRSEARTDLPFSVDFLHSNLNSVDRRRVSVSLVCVLTADSPQCGGALGGRFRGAKVRTGSPTRSIFQRTGRAWVGLAGKGSAHRLTESRHSD